MHSVGLRWLMELLKWGLLLLLLLIFL